MTFQTARRLTIAALVALAAAAPGAQQPQTPQTPQTPTFRGGIDVTPIDVTVVTSSGNPIPDLKPADFRVRVDGRDRTVLRADWIPLARPSGTPPPPPPPEGYSSNEAATSSGRIILITVDQPNIRFDALQDIRASLNRFVDSVQPSDPIAVVALGHGGVSTPFTLDRGVIKRALDLIVGQSSRGRHEKSFSANSVQVDGLGTRPYRRELSASASEAIAINRGDDGILLGAASRECWFISPSGQEVFLAPSEYPAANEECKRDLRDMARNIAVPEMIEREQTLLGLQGLLRDLRRIDAPKTMVFVSEGFSLMDDPLSVSAIGAFAAAARTTIWPLKLEDIRMDASMRDRDVAHAGDRMDRFSGLDLVASASRGVALNLIGNGAGAFAQLERELSGYYLLGVEAVASDADGKAHPINVQVARPGAIVRARRELAYEAAPRTAAANATEAVAEALGSPLIDSGLPIRVATFTMRDADPAKVKLLIHADVGSDYTAGQSVTIGYVVFDDKGKTVVNQGATGRLPTAVSGAPSPLTFSGGATLAPGEYTLKLAIAEGGKVGSVEHRVKASLIDAGTFKLSELMIGGPIDARLLLAPTVGYDVRFGTVQGYIEAYGPNAGLLTMRYEIAPGLDAPSVFSAVVPGRSEGDDRNVFSYSMPVRDLKPGEYFLRASLSSGGNVVRRVARAFRIAPAPAPAPATTSVGAVPKPVALEVRPESLAPRFRRETLSRRDTLQRFRATLPAGATAAFDEGTAALVLGDDAKAEAAFRKSLESGLAGADSTAPLAYLGLTYAAAGKDQEAVGIWQAALVDGAGFPQLYEWMADALLRMGDLDAARPVLAEAINKWPGETGFAKTLAFVFARDGRAREAVALLERYIADHPEDLPAMYSGVQWMYQVHQAGLAVRSKPDDVKLASAWTDAYTLANGPDSDTVKRWMLAMER